jgi:hypothetical protein
LCFREKGLFLQKYSKDTKMKRYLLASLFTIYVFTGWANKVNLNSLYLVLDAAIDSSAIYKKQKMDAIYTLEKHTPPHETTRRNISSR